jgi:catechol 2,3-dioxygenase-like lactoylglutathione lyase family enzyme
VSLALGSTVLDVSDVRRAARFWCDALGYEPRDGWEDEDLVAGRFVVLRPRGAGVGAQLSLQREDAPKRATDAANRAHLDLYATDRAAEVRRLEALGATRAPDWPYPADADFVVMRDLDGNEFCVIEKK